MRLRLCSPESRKNGKSEPEPKSDAPAILVLEPVLTTRDLSSRVKPLKNAGRSNFETQSAEIVQANVLSLATVEPGGCPIKCVRTGPGHVIASNGNPILGAPDIATLGITG